jgi:hypothetical protein
MGSSRTITLFSVIPETGQRSSSFMMSILMHGVAVGLVSLGVLYAPRLNTRFAAERYAVRRLELNEPDARQRAAAGGEVVYPGPHKPPGGRSGAQAAAQPQIAQATPGPQTLVQPDVDLTQKSTQVIPVPSVVIWTPEKTAVKTIVPPQPEKPTVADVRPLVEPPNEEVNLADLGIAASDLAAQQPVVLPATTSPVVIRGPELVQMPPVSTSQSLARPTPATVMSLSNLRMNQGTAALPPVNETAAASSEGGLSPGQARNSAHAGSGDAGSSSRQSAGDGDGKDSPEHAAGQQNPGPAGSLPGANAGAGSQPSADRISLPRDGQFGAVVVGNSLDEMYPEIAGLGSRRMAYTVYLHVGVAKSWILQYSLPASADAAAAGSIARLEAPWPYNIVRPNIAPGAIGADALMLHGFVNQAGRFEALSVAFPSDFEQAQFVLNSLAQWQFRPATQNGQNVKVEVLLIIPDETE